MEVIVFKMAICSFLFVMAITVGQVESQNECRESCADHGGPLIKFPFRLKDCHEQPQNSGYPGFDLSCTTMNQTVLELSLPVKLFVQTIDYKSQIIEVSDPQNCLPRQFLKLVNLYSSPFQFTDELANSSLFNCSSSAERIDSSHIIQCIGSPSNKILVVDNYYPIEYYPLMKCTKIKEILYFKYLYGSRGNILRLKWSNPDCRHCEAKGKGCRLKKNNTEGETDCFPLKPSKVSYTKIEASVGTLGVLLVGIVVFALYRIYSIDREEKESHARIEKFLDDYKAMKPTRYSYLDIKRITNKFSQKLGQGAYGTVYKGKLSDQIYVAVKMLDSSNENGQEFINEVGTIGKIHHVNVVRLVGYCADGFRRALIYEFLQNGSLHDFISVRRCFLGWERLQEIAIGIAKGIECLHQGCDQRILHFDIKPHNVLLDHDFTPKVSDFGLAKLCNKDQSLVSMTTARGTTGYIAPEVFSRNFSHVSYKSDVYSYGMVLLEIVGGRKNTKVVSENASHVYYPEWIYNVLKRGEDMRIDVDEAEEDAKIARKLAIVGLRCIQWHPINRPSMKVVVQMLEGEQDRLCIPPNPFASPAQIKKNTSALARRLNLELEIIPEVE